MNSALPILLKKLQIKDIKTFEIRQMPIELAPFFDGIIIKHGLSEEINRSNSHLIFIQTAAELRELCASLPKENDNDFLFWIAYPKKSSKKYKSEINRDSGWQILGDLGYEGVRQIAIDDDWSALRFRHVSFIKQLTRSFAMSQEGKIRTEK